MICRTATSASTEDAVSTPSSSECDEEVSVTIHADPNFGVVANASTQSSPSAKKEVSKKEVSKKDIH